MAGTDESSKREISREAADAGMRQFADARAQELVSELAGKTSSMPFNPDAALYQTAQEMKLGDMKTDEVRFSLGGVNYIAQGFSEGILYVEDGNWSSFRKVDWLPATAAPSAPRAEPAEASTGEKRRKDDDSLDSGIKISS